MILSLKRTFLVCAVFMLLGLTFVWGLTASGIVKEGAGGAAVVEASHYPLKLMMVLNKTSFEVGETVNMTFILENIGNETLTFSFSDGREKFKFIVYDESGSQVYELSLAYLQLYLPEPVTPGLARMIVYAWSQKYDLIYRGLGEDPIFEGGGQVPKGKYQIVGWFKTSSLGFKIETPPVTITIT